MSSRSLSIADGDPSGSTPAPNTSAVCIAGTSFSAKIARRVASADGDVRAEHDDQRGGACGNQHGPHRRTPPHRAHVCGVMRAWFAARAPAPPGNRRLAWLRVAAGRQARAPAARKDRRQL